MREGSTLAMVEAKSALCPQATGMNQPQPQPECEQTPAYFDPEMPDMSEQQFSASLESVIDQPEFVLDEPEIGATERTKGVLECASSMSGAHDPPAVPASSSEDRHVGSENRTTCGPDWREQVSAKVSRYKSRSRHKPHYPSLQLQFDQIPHRPRQRSDGMGEQTTQAPSFSQAVAAEIVAMQPARIAETELPRITMEATARVLEFPRPSPPVYDPDELAEPMLDRPRILEAPELLPPPPAMGGIMIEPPVQEEPERRPGFDLPLQSAALSRRLWAGAVDALLLAIAVATFTYVFVRIADVIPPWRTVAELCALLFAGLWPAYEYAFLVFSETTPGLRLAKLEIQRFDGTRAPRGLRRWRVLASFLSAASLGLGYAWCFLDEDQLSWHDRITHTHLGSAV